MELDQLRRRLQGRYDIEREIGRGGMGAVYLARDLRLDRPVAIKVLPAEYATQSVLRDRFLRETRTAASFSHPNIVPVYAVEESDDLLAFVMGFVEGESLSSRVQRSGPLSVRDAVKLMQDTGYALAYAHGRGVVHRDIKPDNIMIERATGRALVMDFGVSRSITAAPAATQGLTRVGEVVGTPEYMSPEQASGDTVDGRSDLYSLGLTAFFALTGETAMAAESTGKVLARQIAEQPPSIHARRPDVPQALSDAIDHCLQKDPDARFPSAEALVETLDAAQLSGPEVPLAVRMLGHELATLSLIVIGGALVAIAMIRITSQRGLADLDIMLPVVLLMGVILTRVLQTLSEARRVMRSGFSVPDVRKGLMSLMDERQQRRDELMLDARTHLARKRTVVAALAQLAMVPLLAYLAFGFRTEVRPGYHHVAPAGAILIFTAAILLGMGFVLLIRSPFRMSAGERLFRRFWLGWPGALFLRIAARGLNTAQAQQAFVPVRFAVAPKPPGDNGNAASMEARIAALEEWRRKTERPA
jgi:eukaryotic-like serine/threonine-protein kinase